MTNSAFGPLSRFDARTLCSAVRDARFGGPLTALPLWPAHYGVFGGPLWPRFGPTLPDTPLTQIDDISAIHELFMAHTAGRVTE
jgi:hypothetical protein